MECFSAWRGLISRAGLQCPHSQLLHVLRPLGLSDALTLFTGSLKHLPVLNHVQTPSPPPGLGHGPPHSAAGFVGLWQGRLLHWILFVLLFGAEILDSAWVCTWVWWLYYLSICTGFETRNTWCTAEMAIAASEMLTGTTWGQPRRLQWLFASRSHVFKSAWSKTYVCHKASLSIR